MKRRSFLFAVLASLYGMLGLSTRNSQYTIYGIDSSLSKTISELMLIFSNPDEARAIGLRYLSLHPESRDPYIWLPNIGYSSSNEYDNPIVTLQKMREHDFKQGQTLFFEGWLLARSELSACVLMALTNTQV